MPNPDNPEFHGKKGRSGRKSAYREKADAEMLWRLFMEEMSKDEIKEKLASGKYSIKDVFVSKAFAGNERFITQMVQKLFPDKVESKEEVTMKLDV